MATHELGHIGMIADFETKYSTKQLHDMLEQLDVYDTLRQLAYDKIENNKSKGGK